MNDRSPTFLPPGACAFAVFDAIEDKATCVASLLLGEPPPRDSRLEAIRRQGRIGYVSAGATLVSGFTVAENLTMPLEFQRLGRRTELRAMALRICRLAGVDSSLLELPSDELDGLQRVQATLLQAALTEPEVLLLDAVFDGLLPVRQAELATNLDGYHRLMPLRRMVYLGYSRPDPRWLPGGNLVALDAMENHSG